jgi:hypothetical protein
MRISPSQSRLVTAAPWAILARYREHLRFSRALARRGIEARVMVPIPLLDGEPPDRMARRIFRTLDPNAGVGEDGVVIALGPAWWLGVVAQARRAALHDDPPRLVLMAEDEGAGEGEGPAVSAGHHRARAWLAETARQEADLVCSSAAAPAKALHDPVGWLADLPHGGRAVLDRARRAAHSWIGVVVVHHDRPALLAQALESLAGQGRPPDAVVVVDAATPDAGARARAAQALKAWQHGMADAVPTAFLAAPSNSLGAARALGVRALTRLGAPDDGWALFMDDDNLATSGSLAKFARAAATGGALIWTGWAAMVEGDGVPAVDADPARAPLYAPLGPVPGLLGGPANPAGDAHMLMRLSAFHALGGFDPDPTVLGEDWDLLTRAAITGVAQAVIPAPVLWKRRTPNSLSVRLGWGPARARVRGRLRAAGVPT